MVDAAHEAAGEGRGRALSRRWKIGLSLLIALHLVAVFVAPWSGPPPASDLSRHAMECFEPYLLAAHLLHGYRFFAPQPGPSYLVEYELTMADGSKQTGRFPDLATEWPRLYYHRFFMLSTFVNTNLPLDPPPELDRNSPLYADFLRNRAEQKTLLETLTHAIGAELLGAHGAQQVKLTLVEHGFPFLSQFQAGGSLTDPRSYRRRDLGTYSAEEAQP
ncbi:MAG TPA: hypothetical protein VFE24_10440 [Pirellulales bacterium]|jgi:hypothetical protein|nr:hypothetical protein [Pirellulales bacterium]